MASASSSGPTRPRISCDRPPDAAQWQRLLLAGVPGHHGDVALGQVPGADLHPDRDPLELPVHAPAPEAGSGAVVEPDPVPVGAQVVHEGIGRRPHPVFLFDQEHDDLGGGERRWQAEPEIVAVPHDEGADETGRHTPRGLPDVLEYAFGRGVR